MSTSFAHQRGPLLIGVIRKETMREALAEMRNAQYHGAEAYDLHLSCLREESRTKEEIRRAVEFTDKPVMALYYRDARDEITEEARAGCLAEAVDGGAACVDMQAYTFDPAAKEGFDPAFGAGLPFAAAMPREISMRPEIVEKQMRWITEMHKRGAEVLISCHTGVSMVAEQTVSLAKELERRGADIVKIVGMANTPEEQIEAFGTVYALKKALKAKFSYHCNGKYGKLTRIVNPMLGSYLMFCVDRFDGAYALEQLDLKTAADAMRTLDWRQKET